MGILGYLLLFVYAISIVMTLPLKNAGQIGDEQIAALKARIEELVKD